MPTRQSFTVVLLLLGGTYILNPMALDGTLPTMDAMARAFSTTSQTIQFSLAMLSLGFAIGQLIFGAVSDRYGRRPLMIAGPAVFTLATILIVVAPDVTSLIVLRFIQGFAVSATIIVARAVVRDLYDRATAAKMFAYLFAALGTVPIVAPVVTGRMTEALGWQSVFFLITVIGAAVCASIWRFLRESLAEKDLNALQIRSIAASYGTIMRTRIFIVYAALAGLPYAGLFAILGGMPPSLIGFLGLSPSQYGDVFSVMMLGHFAAQVVAGRLVARAGINRMIVVGAALCALSGGTAWALAAAGVSSVAAIAVPSGVFMAAFAFVVPTAMAAALSPFPQMIGRASSVLGFCQFGSGTLMMFAIGLAADGTQMPMVAALALTGVGSLVMCAAIPAARLAATNG